MGSFNIGSTFTIAPSRAVIVQLVLICADLSATTDDTRG
jgi:hypothetical protein